jgi:hypothetical protein
MAGAKLRQQLTPNRMPVIGIHFQPLQISTILQHYRYVISTDRVRYCDISIMVGSNGPGARRGVRVQ